MKKRLHTSGFCVSKCGWQECILSHGESIYSCIIKVYTFMNGSIHFYKGGDKSCYTAVI